MFVKNTLVIIKKKSALVAIQASRCLQVCKQTEWSSSIYSF